MKIINAYNYTSQLPTTGSTTCIKEPAPLGSEFRLELSTAGETCRAFGFPALSIISIGSELANKRFNTPCLEFPGRYVTQSTLLACFSHLNSFFLRFAYAGRTVLLMRGIGKFWLFFPTFSLFVSFYIASHRTRILPRLDFPKTDKKS